MMECCADIESLPESPPHCVICLTEIVDLTIQPERPEWNWDEACVLKLFEIDPDSLDNFPSLTYFCQTCSLRNQKMWELCSQISLLQQSLQEMKLTLETDFKRGFSLGRSCQILDRTDFLRYQLAKSVKIIPPELSSSVLTRERESTRTSFEYFSETSEFPDVMEEVTVTQYACSENMFIIPECNLLNPLYISSECCEVILNDPLSTEKALTEPKVLGKARRRKVQEKSFENVRQEFQAAKKEEGELKDLKVKIRVIPPDLLTNVPINVHSIPGYVPQHIVRLSSRATMSQIKQILGSESESDVEIVSDREWDCEEEYCSSENTIGTIMNKMGNSGKKSGSGNRCVSIPKTKSHQETQVLKKENSLKSKGMGNREIVKRSKSGFYCTVPECASVRGFSSKAHLEVHNKKVHQGITHPFKCEECGKAYRMLTQMKVHHKTIHLGLFDFKCEVCGKGFKSTCNLEQHRVIHTGERRFKCSECPMNFKTPHGKKLHIRYAHTGERPYTCEVCGKGFVSSTKLNNHLKCLHHSEERPVICHICGKNFPIQGYLYMHMRKHEKEASTEGLPVKRKRRWKKKPEQPSQEEPPVERHTATLEEGIFAHAENN